MEGEGNCKIEKMALVKFLSLTYNNNNNIEVKKN